MCARDPWFLALILCSLLFTRLISPTRGPRPPSRLARLCTGPLIAVLLRSPHARFGEVNAGRGARQNVLVTLDD